jgi:Astacin (Peptidase family M12A)
LNLASPGCINFATIIHEFLHAAGFQHMHSASERDNYVRINFDNVPEDRWHNFNKVSATDFSQFGVPYDFTSVMHYTAYSFAIDPNVPTIESLTGAVVNSMVWNFWSVA